MSETWHLVTPERMFSEDRCRDLADEHAAAMGHRTTEIRDGRVLLYVWCDRCNWHVVADR